MQSEVSKKLYSQENVQPITKGLTKTTNFTRRAKKWRGVPGNVFPPLLNSFRYHFSSVSPLDYRTNVNFDLECDK